MGSLWGIDLGGTKVEGVILSSRQEPEVLLRLRVPTEQEHGYHHVIGQIEKLIRIMEDESGINAPSYIGIGTPGVIDPSSQKLKNSNTVCLNGQYLKRDLEDKMGLEFIVANDANCFAIAETLFGVVKDEAPEARVVIGTIMGTGVGGGIVVDGRALTGKHGIGGEWGHIFLDESGGPCYCGKQGCVETILSGTGLQKFYFQRSGQKMHLKEIVERAHQKIDPIAEETMQRLIKFFGKGISYLTNIVDPDVIVLGGGLGNIEELYTLGVQEVKKHIFNHSLETKFLKPKLGDSAGVIGAAFL